MCDDSRHLVHVFHSSQTNFPKHLQVFKTLTDGENNLPEHLQSPQRLCGSQNELSELLQAFNVLCGSQNGTVLPNYYNRSTGFPVVKKSLTEPLQASTHFSVVKMDFANFYKPTNVLAEHLQAFNVLCRSQDGTDESPRSFNRLPCSHNWLVEPLQALFCSQNGLSEPLEAFNWSKRPCRTPTILQKASWQSKRTFRTSTILQHASW